MKHNTLLKLISIVSICLLVTPSGVQGKKTKSEQLDEELPAEHRGSDDGGVDQPHPGQRPKPGQPPARVTGAHGEGRTGVNGNVGAAPAIKSPAKSSGKNEKEEGHNQESKVARKASKKTLKNHGPGQHNSQLKEGKGTTPNQSTTKPKDESKNNRQVGSPPRPQQHEGPRKKSPKRGEKHPQTPQEQTNKVQRVHQKKVLACKSLIMPPPKEVKKYRPECGEEHEEDTTEYFFCIAVKVGVINEDGFPNLAKMKDNVSKNNKVKFPIMKIALASKLKGCADQSEGEKGAIARAVAFEDCLIQFCEKGNRSREENRKTEEKHQDK